MLNHLFIWLLSFVGIWIGSGIVVNSVQRLSRTLKVSSFTISFVVLGLFTSVSELSVGVNSLISNDPEIYVGNLIGASIVLFLLIIPLLAVTTGSIHISSELRGFNLPASLVVIALPVILAMDGKVGKIDSLIALSLFGFLLVTIETKKNVANQVKKINPKSGVKLGKEFLRILFGISIIFIASRFVVEQTLYFSQILKVSPFLISLLFIAIGTNIPEISLVARSIFIRNHQVAFGDYVGSAAFNTFLLGLLTLVYGREVALTNNYVVSLLYLVAGLLAFYHFAKTKNSISRSEGLLLLLLYLLFLFTEITLHKNLVFWAK